MITIVGATHPGQREHNEDCFTADASLGLGLVADGMGGYACGEIASDLVKHSIERASENREGLVNAISKAHEAVLDAVNRDENKKGMGSTAIAVKLDGLDYELAWVGDSRGYLWDGKSELKQITRDHSYVESLLSTGAITYEEAINHPNKNLITQAVGVIADGGLDIGSVRGRLIPGQQLLLCSDGLVDEVRDSDIAKLLGEAQNPEDTMNNLVQAAVEAGGHDNITVVLVTVDKHEPQTGPAIVPEVIRTSSIKADSIELITPQDESKKVNTQGGKPREDERDPAIHSSDQENTVKYIPQIIVAISVVVCIVAALLFFS